MTKDKIFCGNGKKITFDNGGALINAFLNVDAVCEAFKTYGFRSKHEENTLKIKIVPCKDKEGQYYLEVDTWKPKQ